jgi:hypothetical protein
MVTGVHSALYAYKKHIPLLVRAILVFEIDDLRRGQMHTMAIGRSSLAISLSRLCIAVGGCLSHCEGKSSHGFLNFCRLSRVQMMVWRREDDSR